MNKLGIIMGVVIMNFLIGFYATPISLASFNPDTAVEIYGNTTSTFTSDLSNDNKTDLESNSSISQNSTNTTELVR
jgi:hypothetical protein